MESVLHWEKVLLLKRDSHISRDRCLWPQAIIQLTRCAVCKLSAGYSRLRCCVGRRKAHPFKWRQVEKLDFWIRPQFPVQVSPTTGNWQSPQPYFFVQETKCSEMVWAMVESKKNKKKSFLKHVLIQTSLNQTNLLSIPCYWMPGAFSLLHNHFWILK